MLSVVVGASLPPPQIRILSGKQGFLITLLEARLGSLAPLGLLGGTRPPLAEWGHLSLLR
jgi:hypothetical protein